MKLTNTQKLTIALLVIASSILMPAMIYSIFYHLVILLIVEQFGYTLPSINFGMFLILTTGLLMIKSKPNKDSQNLFEKKAIETWVSTILTQIVWMTILGGMYLVFA